MCYIVTQEFITQHLQDETVRRSTVISMASIRRGADQQHAVDCLTLVTQNGDFMVLDSQAFTILHQVNKRKL